jgi:hypothetical protein
VTGDRDIEEALHKALKSAVFEPNDEPLWPWISVRPDAETARDFRIPGAMSRCRSAR